MKRLMTLLLALSAGCASVAPTQQILVRSEPAGAAVTVECGNVKNDTQLLTPTVVSVHRGPDRCAVLLVKDGYLPAAVPLHKARSAWHVGNVLVGVLTGRVPDTSNAADAEPHAGDDRREAGKDRVSCRPPAVSFRVAQTTRNPLPSHAA